MEEIQKTNYGGAVYSLHVWIFGHSCRIYGKSVFKWPGIRVFFSTRISQNSAKQYEGRQVLWRASNSSSAMMCTKSLFL